MERNPYESPREPSWEERPESDHLSQQPEVSKPLLISLGGILLALVSLAALAAIGAVLAYLTAIRKG